MKATTHIKRPALRYYGGKWRLAPWIISYFPAHGNYVELCGGGGSVLILKPPADLETYNDIDGSVVNFFRVLRDKKKDLIYKIGLTPWARDEYELSLQPCGDEIERARRFFVSSFMSFNGGTGDNPRLHGWRCSTDYRLRRTPSKDLINNVLDKIADRLMTVQIENRDYKNILERFDNDEALIYVDPPYPSNQRTNGKNWYAHEWSNEDHIEAAGLLRQAQGFVVVSGYGCPLYAGLYEDHDWRRVDKETQTNSGGKRIESLWLSPRTWEALQKPRQLHMFSNGNGGEE